MKKKLLALIAGIVSLTAYGAWDKPTAPTARPLTVGEEVYLYNVDFGGFFLGANDWGTRASVQTTHGHKVYIQKLEDSENNIPWDGKSYFLTNFVEKGNMANQVAAMFIDGASSIWVDRAISATEGNQGFTFTPVAGEDNVYYLGLSEANTNDFNGLIYPDSYIGLIPEMYDTRLYLCDINSTVYNVDGYQVRWIFVSPADYETYVAKQTQYEAAVALGKAIEKAKTENVGIDVSSVESIYNNESSSTEQLTAALATLTQLLIDYQTPLASPSNPADYTSFIVNPSYANGDNEGWSGTNPGISEASGIHYDDAEVYNANFDYYQTITGLRNGVYRVQVTGFYRSGSNADDAAHLSEQEGNNTTTYQHAKLYASNSAYESESLLPLQNSGATDVAVPGSNAIQTSLGFVPNSMKDASFYFKAGKYQPATLPTFVSDGTLNIGLRKNEHIGDDWTIWDDWHLYYLGDNEEAYKWLAQQALAAAVDYESLIAYDEEIFYQHSVYDAYIAAKRALESAQSVDAVTSALGALYSTSEALEASIKAYAPYYALYNRALDWVEMEGGESEEAGQLSDYVYSTSDEGFNGNGGARYILDEGPLDAEQIAAEVNYLDNLLNLAMASSMKDGDDCTELLKNPNFSDETGWNHGTSVYLHADNQNLMDGYNVVFNVYQELTGLQNGVYELNYNGLYTPGGPGEFTTAETDKAKCYAYINNYDTKVPGILDNLAEDRVADDDFNYLSWGYGPASRTGASIHFANGRYPAHAYGIVTDGKMKVGFRNDLRVADNSRAWIGPVRLIFRAKNPDALRELRDFTLDIVNTLKEDLDSQTQLCGSTEVDAMMAAADDSKECSDAELYEAVVRLKQSVEDVEEGIVAYQNLFTALLNLGQTIDSHESTADSAVLEEARTLYEEVVAELFATTYTTAEAIEATDKLNAMAVKVVLPSDEASEDHPVNYTELIVNPDFDPTRGDKSKGTIDGWTTTAMNGYKEYTVSYNRVGFELNQKLTGLPKGKYKVTVHTYYRAGYWNDEEAHIAAGEDTHLTTLYVQTSEQKFSKPVINLTEGASDAVPEGVNPEKVYTLSSGKYAPDGTTATAGYFAAGYYLNELEFTVAEDGEATIGLSKTKTYDNDYEVVGAWELWYMGDPATVDNPKDYTSIIVNPDFDPTRGDKSKGTIDGWSTTPMNGYKENSVSYNRAGFELYQDLTGLPEGTYKVTVHTYYRAGYWYDEEAHIAAGEDTHLTTLYAQTSGQRYSKPVVNLTEGASDAVPDGVNPEKVYTLSSGKYAPDGTTPTVAYFRAGYYLNELPFYVGEDGRVRIGLLKAQTYDNDYEVVGEWNLYYYGKGDNVDTLTGIEGVEISGNTPATSMPVGFYSLDGMRLSAPQRGINIIRMSDGSVRKVLVR